MLSQPGHLAPGWDSITRTSGGAAARQQLVPDFPCSRALV